MKHLEAPSLLRKTGEGNGGSGAPSSAGRTQVTCPQRPDTRREVEAPSRESGHPDPEGELSHHTDLNPGPALSDLSSDLG